MNHDTDTLSNGMTPPAGPAAKPAPVRIIVDLETWGTAPGSAIASIGAVKFDDTGIIDEFYVRVDVKSCQAVGMKVDFSTVQWWMQQSDEARAEMCKDGRRVKNALDEFTGWIWNMCEDFDNVEIWGNGAAFDNALLSEAYRLCGIEQPWKYWNDRCYRTMKNMFPQTKMQKREGTHHNALDDAKTQALHLIEILKHQATYSGLAAACDMVQADLILARAELATKTGELERAQNGLVTKEQMLEAINKRSSGPYYYTMADIDKMLEPTKEDPNQGALNLA